MKREPLPDIEKKCDTFGSNYIIINIFFCLIVFPQISGGSEEKIDRFCVFFLSPHNLQFESLTTAAMAAAVDGIFPDLQFPSA